MSEEHRRRTLASIAECNRFIEQEEKRRADIRPADVREYLDFCKRHVLELQARLA